MISVLTGLGATAAEVCFTGATNYSFSCCPECGGSGYVECDCTGGCGSVAAQDDCPACGGSGYHTCPACHGIATTTKIRR